MDRTTAKWTIALLIGITLGCDKPPPPPPSVTGDDTADASTTEPQDRRPTTDEIMSSSWRPVQLGNHPLRLQAPSSWEAKTIGSAVVLRGPAPNGPAPDGLTEITVNKPPPFPKEMAKIFEADLRSAATRPASTVTAPAPAKANAIDAVTAREIGPNRVLDIRKLQPAIGDLPPIVDWRVILFVPAGSDTVNTYQLNFIGLPLDQYQKDKELLEKIVNSLDVDAPSPLAPTTPRIDPFR